MEQPTQTTTERHIGLAGATGIGVGAIVGGGILALAGVAFSSTGPSAILAFALNGGIAMLTALSFAEMASKFPESGGTYTFARKVLSVEAAFFVGWVVWFASIVAAVLYAIGFAYFATLMVTDLWQLTAGNAPAWLSDGRVVSGVAVATTVGLAISLVRRTSGGGLWINIAKIGVFGVLVLAGLIALVRQPSGDTAASLRPFFSNGVGGLVQAMGYTFIALQGFDLIAAVGGEIRDPAKTLPKAMLLSLVIALAVYIPLLFVIATVGSGEASIANMAAANPESIVAVAARNYLGPFGYWLVIAAGVLSMFSALAANLFASSRIALAMARDRTLSQRLSEIDSERGTPAMAIIVTALLVVVILLVLPNVSAAGAASSLIFLITFALAHWITILVRQRSERNPPPFLTPWFPLVPVLGGVSCVGLAVFQALAVPEAGTITAVWLGAGGFLFMTLFARRARVMNAASEGHDPELVTLRGRSPLVLVPVANPQNAEAMIGLADALVPAHVGRVLLQTVVVAPPEWDPNADAVPIEKSKAVLHELLRASANAGVRAETLTSIAEQPMAEISRVAELHQCGTVLLGLSEIYGESRESPLESLLSLLDANVVVLRSKKDWRIGDAKRILIPVGGGGDQQHLRALLLGSLQRKAKREIAFLRVLPTATSADDERKARKALHRLAQDEVRHKCDADVVLSDDPLSTIVERASNADLVIMGVQRQGRNRKLFGQFTRQFAQRSACPMIVMSRKG